MTHDHNFQLDLDGQITCSICGATKEPNPEPTTGYGYDELKDFDMGYKDRPKSRITPFMGTSR